MVLSLGLQVFIKRTKQAHTVLLSLILQFGNVTGHEKWLFIIKPLTRGEKMKSN